MRLSLPLMNHPSLLVLLSRVGSAPSAFFLLLFLFFSFSFTPSAMLCFQKTTPAACAANTMCSAAQVLPLIFLSSGASRHASLWNKRTRERRAVYRIPACISHAGSLSRLSTGHIRKSIIDTCCQALSVIRWENDLTCNEL